MTQVEKAGGKSTQDYDPGYTSENSPPSEVMGSPGSSPKSTFSPMRPPSNMSQDSGIASPFSDDNMSTAVHSVLTRGRRSGSWLGPPNIAVAEETRLCLRAEEVAGCPSHRF